MKCLKQPLSRLANREEKVRGTFFESRFKYTGRLFRKGKASISREVAEVLQRIGTTADSWQARLEAPRKGRLLGRFFAARRERLREVAQGLGLRRVPNLGGCPAS